MADATTLAARRLLAIGKLLGYIRSGEPDLTNRQMAIVMIVAWTTGPHTVRGLARQLGVAKPVITRALNTLAPMRLLRRERDTGDGRNVWILPTDQGRAFLERVEAARG